MDSLLKTAIWLSLIAIGILMYEYGIFWWVVMMIACLILMLTSISVLWGMFKKSIKDAFKLTPEEKKAIREKNKAKS